MCDFLVGGIAQETDGVVQHDCATLSRCAERTTV